MAESYGIDLYWLPLGAGGHSVRLNGWVYEALVATMQRRKRYDLYHSALEVTTPDGTFVIEMAPIPDRDGAERGVVAEGPVGSRLARRLRIFRYEVRRWRGGTIPDVSEAVDSPRHLSSDPVVALRLLALVPQVPTLAGDATKAKPTTCGTRTRSSPGCSHVPASTWAPCIHHLVAARPDGRLVSPRRMEVVAASRVAE